MKLTYITDGHGTLQGYHFIAQHVNQNGAELLIVGGDNLPSMSEFYYSNYHNSPPDPLKMALHWNEIYKQIQEKGKKEYLKIQGVLKETSVPFNIHPGNNDMTVIQDVFKDEFIQDKTKNFLEFTLYAFGHGHEYEHPISIPKSLSFIQKIKSADQEYLMKVLSQPQFAEFRNNILKHAQISKGKIYYQLYQLMNFVSDSFLHGRLAEENPDIICLHRPIYDVGDETPFGKIGSIAPKLAIEQGDVPNAKVVLTGHNHEGSDHKVLKHNPVRTGGKRTSSLEELVGNMSGAIKPNKVNETGELGETLVVKSPSLTQDKHGESGFVSLNLGKMGADSLTIYKLHKNSEDGIADSKTYYREDGFTKAHSFKEW